MIAMAKPFGLLILVVAPVLTICLAEVVFEERFDGKGKGEGVEFCLEKFGWMPTYGVCSLWFSVGRNISLQIGVGVTKENVVSVTRMSGGFECRYLSEVLVRASQTICSKGLRGSRTSSFEITQTS